jgi:hypothetical protein
MMLLDPTGQTMRAGSDGARYELYRQWVRPELEKLAIG